MTTKHDQGKWRFSLLPSAQLLQIIQVLEFGSNKYAVDNWKTVPEAKTRYFDACIRHLTSWWQDEKNDSESGLSHLAHAGCCILFLMWIDDEGVKDETN